MEALTTLISDLDRAVKREFKADRANALKQVDDLYFSTIDLHSDEHVEFFGDLFSLLVDYVDAQVRADLGERVAPLPRAPAKLIRRLANDDEISVAGPVISQSDRLTSDDLTMLARTKGQEHLLAISGRRQLDATVTNVLVERGDTTVTRTVAKNSGAEFSDDGFAHLAQRALDDELLAEIAGTRLDIPPNVLRAILSQAVDTVRERIFAAADPQMKAEIKGVLEFTSSTSRSKRDYTRARELVAVLQRRGRLGEQEVLDFAKAKQFEETVAALSLCCATPPAIIEGFMDKNAAETMPVVCRAAGLSWNATQAVLTLCPSLRGHDDAVMRRALANYTKLSKTTSEKLLRFWFVRGTSGQAGRKTQETPERSRGERLQQHKRRPVNLPAIILADGKEITNGLIEDLSVGGASIRFTGPFKLPKRFVLCLADNKLRRDCEIRWQTRDSVGVMFLT